MHLKQLIIVIVIASLVLNELVVEANVNKKSEETSQQLKVLFVYSNDISDFGYVSAYERARIAVENKLTGYPTFYNLKTSFHVVSNMSLTFEEVSPYVNLGYAAFLFNGGQFTNYANRLASTYPDLKILGTSAIPQFNNTAMVLTRNFEWYFLNGLVCGHVTKTNKVAYLTVFGIHADPYLNANAFWYGATLANPNVEVRVVSSESYTDDVVSTFAIDDLARMGVDCFAINQNTQNANRRANEKGLVSCGTSSDSRFVSGEMVFTSGVRNWFGTVERFLTSIINNTWIPKATLSEGFNQSALEMAWWSTIATEPEYDDMRRDVDSWRNRLVNATSELIFCGSLASLIGSPKTPDQCMSLDEMLSTRSLVPGIIRGPSYTRDSVTRLRYIKWSDTSAIVIVSLACFMCLVLLGTAIHFITFKTREAYRASSPTFMLFILFGMGLICASCLFWPGKPTRTTCALRVWMSSIGWFIIVSALIAKMHRVRKIFTLKNLKVVAIPDAKLILVHMGLMMLGILSVLSIWQGLSPLIPARKSVPGIRYNELYEYCKSRNPAGLAVILSCHAIILLPIMWISWKTRDGIVSKKDAGHGGMTINVQIPDQFKEAIGVTLTSIISFVIGIVAIVSTFIAPDNIDAQFVIPTISMLLIVVMAFIPLFAPKFLYVHGYWHTTTSSEGPTHATDGSLKHSTVSSANNSRRQQHNGENAVPMAPLNSSPDRVRRHTKKVVTHTDDNTVNND